MTTYKISVRQPAINNGRRKNCVHCPVAMEIKDQLGAVEVHVHHYHAAIWMPDGFYRVDLPDAASAFVYNYDGGKEVLPFSFELTLE